MIEIAKMFLPLLGTTVAVALCLWLAQRMLLGRHPEFGSEKRLPRQLTMIGLTVAGMVAVALSLPVSESTRNQVIALLGVLLSGIVAFSSTTIIANLMAGIMLRLTKPFRIGDFIRTGEHFGRVSERGLLDTEIQTEHRELIALPNTYLITNPVGVVRSSGAIVSVTLSLGYDIHHSRVDELLIQAARQTGLEEPFVQVIELGNHAVTYRVSGLLVEVKELLSTRSRLGRAVLDMLHTHGVEIVSPTFMNQRQLAHARRIVPAPTVEVPKNSQPAVEQIVFDKAERAEQQDHQRHRLEQEIQELEQVADQADGETKINLNTAIAQKRKQLSKLNGPVDPDKTD